MTGCLTQNGSHHGGRNGRFSCQLSTKVDQLTKLEELKLDGNQLTSVPASLGKLTMWVVVFAVRRCQGRCTRAQKRALTFTPYRLKTLTLDHNRLLRLPPELSSLEALSVLTVHDNPLEDMPAEVVSRGPAAILSHLAEGDFVVVSADETRVTGGDDPNQKRQISVDVLSVTNTRSGFSTGRPREGKAASFPRGHVGWVAAKVAGRGGAETRRRETVSKGGLIDGSHPVCTVLCLSSTRCLRGAEPGWARARKDELGKETPSTKLGAP